MTQPPKGFITVSDQVLGRIGLDDWSQMNWFLRLANAGDFMTMSQGEQLVWKEEFAAMLAFTSSPMIAVSMNPKLYPGSAQSKESQQHLTVVPTFEPAQMQRVKATTTSHLTGVADGEGTSFKGFPVNYSVSFSRNPAYAKNKDCPRYLIYRGETGGTREERLMLRLSRLLESYAGQIRRCPHCERIFLQLKSSANYCGPKCYTVAGMRRIRKERKARISKQLHQERRKLETKPKRSEDQ